MCFDREPAELSAITNQQLIEEVERAAAWMERFEKFLEGGQDGNAAAC